LGTRKRRQKAKCRASAKLFLYGELGPPKLEHDISQSAYEKKDPTWDRAVEVLRQGPRQAGGDEPEKEAFKTADAIQPLQM
jgi:hypothetical protein